MRPPKAGDVAPDFTLQSLEGTSVELAKVADAGPVVLVVLRGWPGYQCPICTRQVQEFIAQAEAFKARGARVVMVYPGPADKLREHAREFVGDRQWPAEFRLLLDPDFAFTQAYGLRWDAKKETAYPSTFIVGRDRRIRFAHISQSHGDRVSALRALAELK